MSPLDIEIRKLTLHEVLELSEILDKNDSWKKLMAIIPADLEVENSNNYKYTWEDVQLVKETMEKQGRSCTSILIEEWGTDGRVRPRLSTLRKLLVKANLFRAADHVSKLLNVPPPERPEKGPAASIPIPNTNELPVLSDRRLPSSLPSFLQPTPPPSPPCHVGEEDLPAQVPLRANQLDNMVKESDPLTGTSTHLSTNFVQNFQLLDDEASEVPYRALAEVTNNFDENNCLGKGACGTVYLGTSNLGTRKIAIKKLHKEGVPGGADKQFHSEITMISKINHRNLLTLLGFSTDGDSLCLIYPYMPNGSLGDMLATEEGKIKLSWTLRLQIALGVAHGISHLHGLQPEPLIHRDIKTANVLLDEDMTPKLCDFGLIRASKKDKNQSTALTTTIIGTSAYMASEAFRGEISVKMDVFSFGVVLLELLTGLPAIDDDGPLVDTIFDKRIEDCPTSEFSMDDLVDSSAGDWGGDWKNGVANKFLRVALDCADGEKNRRPKITTVVKQLEKIINEN